MADLGNIIWRALSTTQAHLATGVERTKRFVPGMPALIGSADPERPDFKALEPYCKPGDRFYCGYWSGNAPEGWRIEMDTSMCAMAFDGAAPRAGSTADVQRLDAGHVPQMLALAALTKPGPFAERPLEIGEWYGILDEGRLVAIAGERMHAGNLREVSGICTLPEYQGRGYARRLTEHVIRSQLARGLTPFLHVASSNVRARRIYERMGFVVEREVPLRVVAYG